MTYEEQAFRQGYVLASDIESKETRLELWGGSTKHADCIFSYTDWKREQEGRWYWTEGQILNWLLECASKLTFSAHAFALADWALGLMKYRGWEKR